MNTEWIVQYMFFNVYLFFCDFSEDQEAKRKKETSKKRKRALLIGLGAVGGGVLIGM